MVVMVRWKIPTGISNYTYMHASCRDFPLLVPQTCGLCVWVYVCADAVLLHLPGPAGILPIWGH